MRYAIFSDVHSNLEAFNAVIASYKSESIDRYLCIGDVVGYATNPEECIGKVKSLATVTVAGNHDWATVHLFSDDYFNDMAREAIFWTRKLLDKKEINFLESLKLTYENEDLTLVHGTLDRPQEFEYLASLSAAEATFGVLQNDICFVGHSHVAGTFISDELGRVFYTDEDEINMRDKNRYIVNVGSVGQPRDGDPRAACCIYDTAKRRIEIKRVKYDIDSARRKIIRAGLPQFLGDRLLAGR
jgi:predicted phosphodiesterase